MEAVYPLALLVLAYGVHNRRLRVWAAYLGAAVFAAVGAAWWTLYRARGRA